MRLALYTQLIYDSEPTHKPTRASQQTVTRGMEMESVCGGYTESRTPANIAASTAATAQERERKQKSSGEAWTGDEG